MEENERLDIVNSHDEVIGQKWRNEVTPDDITRTSICFLEDQEGKILIAQRDASKPVSANKWSVAVAETVQAGEDYLTAMIRGAYEEINLSTNTDQLNVREKEFCTRKNTFRQIYFLVCTEKQKMNLVPRPGEVQEIKWVSLPELKKMMQEDPSIYSESLPEILPYREQYKQDIIDVLQEKRTTE